MPFYNCCGIELEFPFEAYPCQVEYMRHVITALNAREHALLESPTGTGKTLCLLCAVLSWQKQFASRTAEKPEDAKEDYHAWEDQSKVKDMQSQAAPRIIYTSRTHSQIRQVTKELKKTSYSPSATVVASREQLCVNKFVKDQKGAKQNALCNTLCANSRQRKKDEQEAARGFSGGGSSLGGGGGKNHGGKCCAFYNSVFTGKYKDILKGYNTSLMDIEELTEVCADHWVCPYFKTRADAASAELVMCPYNYLIDPSIRAALKVNLKNSIVIFDEGHNIESVCEDSSSFELSMLDITSAMDEIDSSLEEVTMDNCAHLVRPEVDDQESGENSSAAAGNKAAGTTGSSSSGASLMTKADLSMLLLLLKQKLLNLQERILKIDLENSNAEAGNLEVTGETNGTTRRQRVINAASTYEIFRDAGITIMEYPTLRDAIDKAVSCFALQTSVGGISELAATGKALEKIQKVFSTLFENIALEGKANKEASANTAGNQAKMKGISSNNALPKDGDNLAGGAKSAEWAILESRQHQIVDDNYRVIVCEESKPESGSPARKRFKPKNTGWGDCLAEATAAEGKKAQRSLCFWCFTSAPAMQDLVHKQGVRSIIITSGTLSPISATKVMLGIPFNVTLENAHVINGNTQLFARVVGKSQMNTVLRATFANKDNWDYMKNLGYAVAGLCERCPDGVLLAFASYAQMDRVVNVWKTAGIYERLEKCKELFIEPKGSDAMKSVWAGYTKAIEGGGSTSSASMAGGGSVNGAPPPSNNRKGAIIFAIARGKLTEGVDFTDKQCRAVFVCGIPYPPVHDPRIRMKKQFLTDKQLFNAEDWYQQQAARAVNQTVGRVIRHSQDFGAVLLCDERFGTPQMVGGLSRWLQPQIRYGTEWKEVYKNMCMFFKGKRTGVIFDQTNSSINNAGKSVITIREEKPDVEMSFAGRAVSPAPGDPTPSSRAQDNTAPLNMSSTGTIPNAADTVAASGAGIQNGSRNQQQQQKIGNPNQQTENVNVPSAAASSIAKATVVKPVQLTPGIFMKAGDNGTFDDVIQHNPTHNLAEFVPVKLEKQTWMEAAQTLFDDEDFTELTTDILPGLKKHLPDVASSKSFAEYQKFLSNAVPVFLPALWSDGEEQTRIRQQLVWNFQFFVHPKMRPFYKKSCNDWIQEQSHGEWATCIFK